MRRPSMSEATDPVRRLLLRVPKRRRVFEAVVACPGTHARRLSRDLAIALGVVEHHVRQLERHGLIFSFQQGRRRTLYAAGHVDPLDARVIHLLRKPVWCRILAALAQHENGAIGLAMDLGLPTPTASYHLRRLRSLGAIEHVRAGRESAFFLREPERVTRLLEALRPQARRGGPDPALHGLVERALRVPSGHRPPRPRQVVLAVKD
jgi:DNA-binding transcriptional ArsR family regulator